ncbi:MAG: bifunctional (p)ppGpp synthetase/guanosine-3',5'-bis(diphosphate) 3'-pyrophosphohydrolase [Actinobacteria bacterium]|nr:bifunctional (p)ppGpp synthetase/guanosine-3',5'-bis(diphosphate) 3'-pyrophosphohydrolase [Actinomycetota bacterium]
MARIRSLINKVKRYNPGADIDAIRKAYNLARKLHVDQYRKSGEDFVSHPVEVADILADLGMDTTTILAALLHDVVEDTSISLDDLRDEVSEDVVALIDGVTKLGKIEFRSREEEQAENLRKMFIAMAKDIRVIIIKLADRLHNMRTIRHLDLPKQQLKAEETLEIYAPLAHRLGIMSLKWELEDLSFQALETKMYDKIQNMVAERRSEREEYLRNVIKALDRELKAVHIEAEISGRPKHFYSIYEKMVKKGRDFSEIYDLSAVRVLVDSIKDCYGALGIIHAMWKPVPGRFKDFVAMPKFNMYQSLHTTVVGPMGKPLEIQIRTYQMHRTAEYGIAAHWHYKEGGKEDKFDERLIWLRQMLEWQSELNDPRDFMESLKIDLFQDEVYVFTPKGDVINLPAGSTPLDFAYTIHTDVGHRCIGAKVNNQIVTLEYKLKTGDFVEILTSKTTSGPSKDWLKIVKSSRARNKIRQWFTKENREESEDAGRDMLQKELRKIETGMKSPMTVKVLEAVVKELNFTRIEDVYASIGAGKTSAKQVVGRIADAIAKSKDGERAEADYGIEELQLEITQKRKPRRVSRSGVIVKGLDDVLVRVAHCCNPVPGDDIMGFVTRGRGVSVHRSDCSNAKQLKQTAPDRLIEVSWDERRPSAFQVEVEIEALDRPKLLRDVSTVLGDAGVNILSAAVTTNREHIAVLRFVFEIGDISHLQTIIGNVRKVPAVYEVYRVEPNTPRRQKIVAKSGDEGGGKR